VETIKNKSFLFRTIPLLAVSALLLTVISAPTNFSFLAWVAIVPFLMACSPTAKRWQLVLCAWAVGFVYWAGNLYWIWYVTAAGHIALCFYLGAYWAALAACVRYCRIRKFPLFLAAPILWAGAETFQGWFCDGVAWRFLAHSQYANIGLIQIGDMFSTDGVTFLIAMVNGLIADILLFVWPVGAGRAAWPEAKRGHGYYRVVVGLLITIAAVSATLVYGHWRIGQWKDSVKDGPIVASVQSNVPLDVKESGQASEQIFNDLMRDSLAAQKAKPLFIAWPETMVQAVLNPDVLRLVEPNSQDYLFDKALREHVKGKCYLLVGAYGRTVKWVNGRPGFDRRYNSAFLYRPDGTQDSRRYDKIHLVPFGEVVPFKKSIPWLHSLLMKLTPYDFDYTLDYGTDYTVFEIVGGGAVYRFGVLICYEDTVPYIARKMAVDSQGEKKADWLVNISNDGWFVRFVDSNVLPSTELSQHTAVCVFRAVENRLPVLRSVNTGISCLIDSQGRIRDGFIAGNLPRKAMQRQGMAGWFADRIPIDKRVTFFSIHGQWLGFTCAILFIVTLLVQFLAVRSRRPEVL
jgi:apolipoprotein N-acyltransferase